MRIRTPGFAVASAVILCQLLPAGTYAQESRDRAPAIRLSAALGSSLVTNYIEPTISLSEDAYVFAISVDVDRNIQVLHPDDPGISVRMSSRKQLHLPRFFAGYYQTPRFAGSSMREVASLADDYYEPGFSDTRGTIIALASRKPFNLDAVTVDGQWDLEGVRLLVDGRDPSSAAMMLARYLGAKGEPIGRDVHRFAGAPRYYRTAYYDCHPIYGAFGYGGYGRGVSRFRAFALQQAGYRVQYLGIDACGQPRFAVLEGPNLSPTPRPKPPATGAFPRSRVPSRVPRNPTLDQAIAGRTTVARPHTGESTGRGVTYSPSRGRTADPVAGVDRPRRPVGASFPERDRNRVESPRAPAAASPAPRVSEPRPVFRPEPQVTRERKPDPPPAPRAVERPREKPQPSEAKPVDQ